MLREPAQTVCRTKDWVLGKDGRSGRGGGGGDGAGLLSAALTTQLIRG